MQMIENNPYTSPFGKILDADFSIEINMLRNPKTHTSHGSQINHWSLVWIAYFQKYFNRHIERALAWNSNKYQTRLNYNRIRNSCYYLHHKKGEASHRCKPVWPLSRC